MLKSKVKEESGVRALGIRFFFREENLCSFKAFCMSWTKNLWRIKKVWEKFGVDMKRINFARRLLSSGLKILDSARVNDSSIGLKE